MQLLVEHSAKDIHQKAVEIEIEQLQVTKSKRAKLLNAFKKKKGTHSTMAKWVSAFDNDMRIQLETTNSNIKTTQARTQKELEKLLTVQIGQLQKSLDKSMSKSWEAIDKRLSDQKNAMNDRLQFIENKQTDEKGYISELVN